jgi:DNA modification methylase
MSITISKNAAQVLGGLLAGDLEFHQASSSYASHSLHAFAAKFPPQLPRLFIEHLTEVGEVVLDPMVGSGTSVVEAYLLGRRGIGVDIDPLALHICRVKTTHIEPSVAVEAGERAIKTAGRLLEGEATVRRFLESLPEENRQFIDYWFGRNTQSELAALLLAIGREPDDKVRDFLNLVFSSIIMTKSGGVSLARDLAHSRPHRDDAKVPRNAIEQFRVRLLKSAKALVELRLDYNGIEVREGDCRRLPLEDDSAHLVVTSPPYANAIDYVRAHKFSLVWLGQSITFLSRLRGMYIGAEKVGELPDVSLPRKTEATIQLLTDKDAKKATILRKYFLDMRATVSEMRRVLLPGRAAIIVVGTSTMRGLRIDTPLCLGEIAEEAGFRVVGIKERKLDRNRRMMPARFQNNGRSMIEQRMHEESVIGLVKI